MGSQAHRLLVGVGVCQSLLRGSRKLKKEKHCTIPNLKQNNRKELME